MFENFQSNIFELNHQLDEELKKKRIIEALDKEMTSLQWVFTVELFTVWGIQVNSRITLMIKWRCVAFSSAYVKIDHLIGSVSGLI